MMISLCSEEERHFPVEGHNDDDAKKTVLNNFTFYLLLLKSTVTLTSFNLSHKPD